MEHLIGFERGIIVDALPTGRHSQGTVTICRLQDLPDRATGHTTAAHDTSLQTALELGREMGVALPEEVLIVGVETETTYAFSQTLSPPVESAVPEAAQAVLALLTRPAVLKYPREKKRRKE